MGWLQKKPDPLSEREQALTEEIAALEEQIRRLDSKLTSEPAPKLRSTAIPHAGTVSHSPKPTPDDPIFEEIDEDRIKSKNVNGTSPEHFNELGVRKYDLADVVRRMKERLKGRPTSNPKLVNYLAAGSIQGLRPMRYEKRVARYRFMFLVVLILLVLLGIYLGFKR